MRRIYKILILLFSVVWSQKALATDDVVSVNLVNLRCEMLVNPKSIDVTRPRLSWQLNSELRGIKQTAYQIFVASSIEKLNRNEGDLWNSGKINSDLSVLVPYAGKPLISRQECFWKVKVWTNRSEVESSEPASFTFGLLKPEDWKAKWIGLDKAFPWDSVSKFSRLSARYLRKQVEAEGEIKKATVYISGLGLYELYVNGQKIGDQVLAPGPTDYSKTILYNTFDLTGMIKQGKNVIGTVLGNGRFFTMRQNYKPQKWHTFGFPKMLLQLEIEYEDGKKQIVVSDETWKVTADGPIRTNNEYDGEEYDATRELTGWNNSGYNDGKWLKVQLVKAPGGILKAQMNENMIVMESINPVSIKEVGGKYILDMGQNMAGWIKMQVEGKRGSQVKLRFAESLQPNGELYVANLRDAIVTDIYTLKGEGKESWKPSFVYHGFRFVEVSGYPGIPTTNDFVGEVVYDNIKSIGAFETSNKIINQIHTNAYWGIRGNYKGMPVDCPQRNERQPWLGDRTTGAYGESFLFDNSRLYAKWLDDIRDAQTPEGRIPDVAPNFWYYYKDNMTWPGAYLTIANMLYHQYGDRQSIVKHYPAMKKWMAYMRKKYTNAEGVITKDSYGDWCVPPESPQLIHAKDSSRITNPQLIATTYYYYLLQLMQKFAALSNNESDCAEFEAEAARVKTAFNKKFYNSNKSVYANNTVTSNILPLAFDMVPEGGKEKVFQNIVDKTMNENKGHISTGVIGTQWIMRWLTKYNRPDLAFRLASNTTYPSWGYMVENGATTIWELWNGNTANPSMNSQNHVMLLGDLLIWMYENLGGIHTDSTEVAFKRIIMKPSFDVDLSYVNASYQSPFGTIGSSWKKEDSHLKWDITIPANTVAVIHVPAKAIAEVREGNKPASEADCVQFLRMENGKAVFQLGSGNYSFTVTDRSVSGR